MRRINIGLIGWGTIGTGVTKILQSVSESVTDRIGAELYLKKVADLDITTPRDINIPQDRLTTKAGDILDDPEIDIVIELIGGIEPARTFILKAINNKKQIVTANKALLSQYGKEILTQAKINGVDVGFEASVGGGIPVIRGITEGLFVDRIRSVYGIINGTCNYILTRMYEEKKGFDEVLKEAQKLGYAEADPAYDIKGIDTAHKIAILATLAFGGRVELNQIYTEGIDRITLLDLTFAAELGYRIKLLALAKKDPEGLEVRVHPTMISQDSLLASIDGVYNAIYVISEFTGPTMFYGQGAGQMPTATAIFSNIVEIARNILYSNTGKSTFINNEQFNSSNSHIKPIQKISSIYYLHFSAMDRPGVLSSIAGILGNHDISISSVIQKERGGRVGVPIIMLTHKASEASLQAALSEIDSLPMILDKTLCIRMESLPS